MRVPEIVAIAILVAACTHRSEPDAPTPNGALGADTLTIPLSGSVRTSDRGATVTFERVVADSRCARNVVCVWQGDAAVHLKVVSADGTIEATIHTAIDPKTMTLGKRTLSIVDLSPYPGSGETGPQRVTVVVTPAPSN